MGALRPRPLYTAYRKGLLKKVYQYINPNEDFIHDCMTCPELNSLLENSLIHQLDEVGGLPKLALTIFAKCV
jgi:hypothetical protein